MGRLDKDNNPGHRFGALLLAVILGSCAADGRNDRYAGQVDAEQGVCGPIGAGQHMVASLQIRGDQVLFAPDEGVVLLQGRIDVAGHVTASLDAPGADHKPFPMVFEGSLHGMMIDGRYATPRCRAKVQLHRVT
jgi:hypothetical protein